MSGIGTAKLARDGCAIFLHPRTLGLGAELVRVPGATWNRRAPELARAYGLSMPLPVFHGAGAVDPRVALLLACEFGENLDAAGDDLYLRIRADRRDDPLVRVFLAPGDDSLQLS